MLGFTFTDLFHSIRVLVVSASFFGGLLILVATLIKRSKKESLWGDILRDVGIAFLVAVIVTVIFELHMRTAELHGMLTTIMQYNVPKRVWEDVNKDILKRDALRRNVKVEFEVKPDPSLRAGLALLGIKYSYDLYRLKSDSGDVSVQHEIVSDYNKLAHFEHVLITDAKGQTVYRYDASPQDMRKGFKTSVYMEPGYNFEADTFDDQKAFHVVNERVEIINLPGIYSLGMPEVIYGSPDSPISVSVKVSEDLESRGIVPSIDTQWATHAFKSNGKQCNQYTWTYDGILLPGQFFDVRVSEPVTSPLATPP